MPRGIPDKIQLRGYLFLQVKNELTIFQYSRIPLYSLITSHKYNLSVFKPFASTVITLCFEVQANVTKRIKLKTPVLMMLSSL